MLDHTVRVRDQVGDFIPELHWRYRYFTVLVFIATVCVPLYRGFKRNG